MRLPTDSYLNEIFYSELADVVGAENVSTPAMLPLAEKYGLIIAGGDTNTWDKPLVAKEDERLRPLDR